MTHSFPLAGRADGEKRKEPQTVKIFPYRHHRNPCGFLRSCGIRKTSLRQRLHSTATYLIDFSISGTGVRVKIRGEKSVRVGVTKRTPKGLGLRFKRTASTASVCTLAETGALPYRSDLLNSKHIRCGHTPEKWAFRTVCWIAIFSILGVSQTHQAEREKYMKIINIRIDIHAFHKVSLQISRQTGF